MPDAPRWRLILTCYAANLRPGGSIVKPIVPPPACEPTLIDLPRYSTRANKAEHQENIMTKKLVSLCSAAFLFGIAETASAQSTAWGPDNCLYQSNGRTWVRLNACRVVRTPQIFDTYDPTKRQWMLRIQETPSFIDMTVIAPGALYGTVLRFYTNGSPTYSLKRPGGTWENFFLNTPEGRAAQERFFGGATLGGGGNMDEIRATIAAALAPSSNAMIDTWIR
jgi:hypothetical protein